MRISATCVCAREVPSAFMSMRPTIVFVRRSSMSGSSLKGSEVTSPLLSTDLSRCFADLDLSHLATRTPQPFDMVAPEGGFSGVTGGALVARRRMW